MTADSLKLTQLADREAIRDCLARYCRGIDRCDRALLESTFWPDAVDDHVTYVGSASGFIEWVMPLLKTMELTQHFLGQAYIQLDGESAAVETYLNVYHRIVFDGVPKEVLLGGRYLDRFEKRGDDWRIAFRRVIGDWHRTDIVAAAGWESFVLGRFPARNIGTTLDDPSVALLAGHWL